MNGMLINAVKSFNPYSTGFSSFIIHDHLFRLQLRNVSILILLDSLLLYKGKFRSSSESILCFNPYSTGFSSFILLPIMGRRCHSQFQSLFYWILFFYDKDFMNKYRSYLSFNPYSTGFSSFIL